MASKSSKCKFCNPTEIEYIECEQPIVIDNGSCLIKSGFAGDDKPLCLVPPVVGRQRHAGVWIWMDTESCAGMHCWVGNNALRKRGILSMSYPMQSGGIIKNWYDMETIWSQMFRLSLCIKPDGNKVLLSLHTSDTNEDKENRERSAQIMFETFNVSSLYVAQDSVLSLYASGRLTGIALHSGFDASHSVPIYEGYSLKNAVNKINIGGKHVTDYLMQLLTERGYSFTTTAERVIVKEIKESLGYVALDFDQEMKKSEISSDIENNYELPDGQVITIGNEQFRCSEALFVGVDNNEKGVDKMLYDSIMKCEKDLHGILFENIMLCGGNTFFNGMVDRLKKEITALAHGSMPYVDVFYGSRYSVQKNEILVDGFIRHSVNNLNQLSLCDDMVDMVYKYTHYSPSKPTKYLSWIGGSILAQLSTFNEMCVSQKEYDEKGASIVYRKCL